MICVVLVAFGVSADASSGLANGTSVDTLLLPAVVLPILARRRWPLGAAVGLLAGAVVSGIPTFDQFRLALVVPAGMLILFSVASRCEQRRAWRAWDSCSRRWCSWARPTGRSRASAGWGRWCCSVPACLVSWGAGRAAWSRDRIADRLATQTALLERQREHTADLAVEVERTRLASDLDMAARVRVREMIELAQRGELALGADPDGARAAFAGSSGSVANR